MFQYLKNTLNKTQQKIKKQSEKIQPISGGGKKKQKLFKKK